MCCIHYMWPAVLETFSSHNGFYLCSALSMDSSMTPHIVIGWGLLGHLQIAWDTYNAEPFNGGFNHQTVKLTHLPNTTTHGTCWANVANKGIGSIRHKCFIVTVLSQYTAPSSLQHCLNSLFWCSFRDEQLVGKCHVTVWKSEWKYPFFSKKKKRHWGDQHKLLVFWWWAVTVCPGLSLSMVLKTCRPGSCQSFSLKVLDLNWLC